MTRSVRVVLAAALIAVAADWLPSALAEPLPESLRARAAGAIDGDTFSLSDGREVRLAGIAAAKAVTAAAMEDPPPIVARAGAALEQLIAGREVDLVLAPIRFDRHRRLLAQVYVPELPAPARSSSWVQGELLRQGMARVATTLDTRSLAAEMLSLEREARAEGRGMWALEFYRILTAEEAGDHIGGFHLVEGRVRGVSTAGGRTYVNFGDDWRTDFTIAIASPARRLFRAAGLDLQSLQAKALRARGWVESYNGAFIEVTHPEQIEVLEE